MPSVAYITAALIGAHFLCDYPLQGEYLSQAKNRHTPVGGNGVWLHGLTAHASIQGFGVLLVTQSVLLAVAETVVHWITDFIRCDNRITYHQDQAIHLSFRLLWAALYAWFI
jgi:hypothetical protein